MVVFQKGVGTELFGFEQVDAIEAWLPLFAGFATGELVMFPQMGFGVAVALLLDATLIRSVLVPAAIELLGEHNWYLPKWLEWLPHYEVEATNSAIRRPISSP